MVILAEHGHGKDVYLTTREYKIALDAIVAQNLLDREEADAQEAGRVVDEVVDEWDDYVQRLTSYSS